VGIGGSKKAVGKYAKNSELCGNQHSLKHGK